MPQLDIEKAISNPAASFATPEAIAADTQLTPDQKIAALRQWDYDVREVEVAEEEGMVGGGDDLLQRILIVMKAVGYRFDGDNVAPTKQHPFTD